MKKEEWNEGLNNIDSDLVEKYVEEKDLESLDRALREMTAELKKLAETGDSDV